MSKGRERQRANRKKYKGGQNLGCSRFTDRDLNPIPQGGIKPHNCKTPCPYGTGRTFCFPCMAKIMDERRQSLRKAG